MEKLLSERKLHAKALASAKKRKNDEFYTQIKDVENELSHYIPHFKDKAIYCNCDNPRYSAFWRYLVRNFKAFGLRKLSATYYVKGRENSFCYSIELIKGERVVKKTPINGDGDFRSPDCIKILEESDIVITNPPFSLIREYVPLLDAYKKKFLVLANFLLSKNPFFMKKIFIEKSMWFGRYFGKMKFRIPDDQEFYGQEAWQEKDGRKYAGLNNITWLTNLKHNHIPPPLKLTESYTPENYPSYDNYPKAIEVGELKKIPKDYFGIMGVPSTYMPQWNPEQFEFLGLFNDHNPDVYDYDQIDMFRKEDDVPFYFPAPFVNGKQKFCRVAIRRKRSTTLEEKGQAR